MVKPIKENPVVVLCKGQIPENNIVRAKVNNGIMGPKITFPHRHSAVIDTGLELSVGDLNRVPCKLCFRLVPALAERGMVATNAPGNLKNGKLVVTILNCGREIVELKDGDPLVEVWVEFDLPFVWRVNEG